MLVDNGCTRNAVCGFRQFVATVPTLIFVFCVPAPNTMTPVGTEHDEVSQVTIVIVDFVVVRAHGLILMLSSALMNRRSFASRRIHAAHSVRVPNDAIGSPSPRSSLRGWMSE